VIEISLPAVLHDGERLRSSLWSHIFKAMDACQNPTGGPFQEQVGYIPMHVDLSGGPQT